MRAPHFLFPVKAAYFTWGRSALLGSPAYLGYPHRRAPAAPVSRGPVLVRGGCSCLHFPLFWCKRPLLFVFFLRLGITSRLLFFVGGMELSRRFWSVGLASHGTDDQFESVVSLLFSSFCLLCFMVIAIGVGTWLETGSEMAQASERAQWPVIATKAFNFKL